MNIIEVSQHISENILYLSENAYPNMKVVVLVHSGNSNISMISNAIEQAKSFEILSRGLASCFDPLPRGEFSTVCRKYIEVIKPSIATLNYAEGIICFWEQKTHKAAMISTIGDVNIAIAIICEHMIRVISGHPTEYQEYVGDNPRVLH